MPGGKLVVVDLEVGAPQAAAGSTPVVWGAQISGDFFLEPDEALPAMAASLVGLDVESPLTAYEEAVESAARGAVLVGFDARSVAFAVLRALGRSTGWQDLAFDLLDTGPQHPAMQMALDEVVARQVGEGLRPPTLRVWEWASNAVIIGSFQSLTNEVDLEAARRHDTTVVRRISGGGAMFVEPGNTITFSLYVPTSLVEGLSFVESYRFLDAWVVRALRELGVDATYQPLNDIASPVGKIGGAAQKRLASGVVLHHVTMSYDMDAAKLTDILRIGREKLSDKGHVSAGKRVDPIRSQTGMPREDVVAAMVAHFEGSYGELHRIGLDDATRRAAEELAVDKYADPAWTARVP